MTGQKFDATKKTFVVVSGASRGIGATIAIDLSKLLNESTFVLLARSETGLEKVESEITQTGNDVLTHSLDLSKPNLDSYQRVFSDISKPFAQKIIFHNAGQVGTLDKTVNLNNLQHWQSYYDLNLFSATLLNSAFLTFRPDIATFVVNISSLCGSVPFSNMSMYGSAKAARNLFFKVLAVEEPAISVLNYSPGPVDTDMVTEVISNMKDDSVRSEFVKLRETQTILKPAETIGKLLGLLGEGNYKSGDLVDYYDRKIDA